MNEFICIGIEPPNFRVPKKTRRKRCVGTIAQHKRHDSFYEIGLSSEVYEVIIVANGCVCRENV